MGKQGEINRLIRSFGFAFDGYRSAFAKDQKNIKIHLLIAVCVLAASILLKISRMEWITVICCIGLVICSEIFNTAIEKLADHVSPERNSEIKQVKDLAAAAVLTLCIVSVLIGLLIFIPKLIVQI
jgi:diacylglycerol kinase